LCGHSTIDNPNGDLVVDPETRVVSVHDKPVQVDLQGILHLRTAQRAQGRHCDQADASRSPLRRMDAPELKIIDVFVCNLRKKLPQATGSNHYIETV
jgi:DNA-binding response OmpR family regulator